MPRGYDRVVVQGLGTLTGGVGAAVSSVTITRHGRSAVVLDETVKKAVRVNLDSVASEPHVVSGRLHMGDFAPSALRCRIDTPLGSVTCTFDEGLHEAVLAAMDRLVIARGIAERRTESGEVRVVHIDGIEFVEESRTYDGSLMCGIERSCSFPATPVNRSRSRSGERHRVEVINGHAGDRDAVIPD